MSNSVWPHGLQDARLPCPSSPGVCSNPCPLSWWYHPFSSFQFTSVAQSCPTLCNSRDCSTPGFPVLHHLPDFAQTHVHWVDDTIQPSGPLSSPSPPAFSLSQYQGLLQWVSSLHQVAKYWSFSFSISPSNEYSGWFPLGLTSLISLLSKGVSRVFSSIIIGKQKKKIVLNTSNFKNMFWE